MIDDLFPHPLVARTGRIENWMKNPDGRLPVSCTVFVVEDSIEGKNGIEASWRFVSHALRFGAGVAVHLSKIRPAGHTNDKGLVASGPVSFGKIYSALNETIRRGGVYKNGACVLHLDLDHPDNIANINSVIVKYSSIQQFIWSEQLFRYPHCISPSSLQFSHRFRELYRPIRPDTVYKLFG